MYLSLLGFAVLSIGESTSAEARTKANPAAWIQFARQQGLDQLKAPDPTTKYAANLQALSTRLQAGLEPWPTRPEAERKGATDLMMQTVVEDDEPLVQGAPAVPTSSLISSKRFTGVSSPLSADADLVSGVSGINLEWGTKSRRKASVASMSQQHSHVAPSVAGHVNAYLEGIDFELPATAAPKLAASMIKQKVKVTKQMVQRVQVEDTLDQSKLKGALSGWLSAKKLAKKPVSNEQQLQWTQQQQELKGLLERY